MHKKIASLKVTFMLFGQKLDGLTKHGVRRENLIVFHQLWFWLKSRQDEIRIGKMVKIMQCTNAKLTHKLVLFQFLF